MTSAALSLLLAPQLGSDPGDMGGHRCFSLLPRRRREDLLMDCVDGEGRIAVVQVGQEEGGDERAYLPAILFQDLLQ